MNYLKKHRNIVLMFADCLIIYLSYVAANFVRYDINVFSKHLKMINGRIPIMLGIYIVFFVLFRLYKSLWEHASIEEFIYAIGGNIMAGIGIIIVNNMLNWGMSFGIILLSNLLIFMMVFGLRISFRVYRRFSILMSRDSEFRKKTMVIGAGSAGAAMIKEMKTRKDSKYSVVCCIDDDKLKQGKKINGVHVYGGREKIIETARELGVELILIAIPSISKSEKAKILEICTKTKSIVKHVPDYHDIIKGEVTLGNIRDINFEDLLGRDEVKLDNTEIEEYITGRRVIVTGGGGSIGSELCRQIARFKPKELVILDIYENNAYDIQNELVIKHKDLKLDVIIASVRDRKRIYEIFNEKKPEVVFHAAAHKHVPLMERSPMEAIKNNVFGTYNVVNAAHDSGVKKFVLISTDKAVNPTNVMGATKRICEMIVQAKDRESDTKYVAVRFGNVLGSNGSVIPLFVRQIKEGGPVTVTHKDITRFFMTISEASQLVLQAGAYANGGEIFVLDMGQPVKIYEFAEKLITLMGYEPHVNMPIEVTGLRPGEKLYEELLMDEEGLGETPNKKIFIGKPGEFQMDEIETDLNMLLREVDMNNVHRILDAVERVVPTYVRLDKDEKEVAAAVS